MLWFYEFHFLHFNASVPKPESQNWNAFALATSRLWIYTFSILTHPYGHKLAGAGHLKFLCKTLQCIYLGKGGR